MLVAGAVLAAASCAQGGPPEDHWADTDEYVDLCRDQVGEEVPEDACRCMIDVARQHYDSPREFSESDGESPTDQAFAAEFVATCALGASDGPGSDPQIDEEQSGDGNDAVCATVDELNDLIAEVFDSAPGSAAGFEGIDRIESLAQDLDDVARSSGADDNVVEMADDLSELRFLDADAQGGSPFLAVMADLNFACD